MILFACALAACDDDASDSCSVDPLSAQASTRFQAGRTFYLPVAQGNCGSARWALLEAPEANRNALVIGENYTRFSPTEPGTYVFQLGETDRVETLTVVSHDTYAFHHLNYYPTRSLAVVNGDLWVANVYSPFLSVLNLSNLSNKGEIQVGPWPTAIAWREGLEWALVAQRGQDTIGFVEVNTQRLVDSVWVGDEPANLIVHPTEAVAYTVLSTTGEVVKIDLSARRAVTTKWVIRDPMALAMNPDGSTIAVAAYRSGHPNRFPYESDPAAEEVDVVILDSDTLETTATVMDLGTTIRGLEFSPDGSTLYVANTRNDTVASLSKVEDPSFIHEVVALDAETGSVTMRADLLRQPSSTGHAVQLYGLAITPSSVFVASEGTDELVELEASSLVEVGRYAAPGRPRGVITHGEAVFVHGAQSFQVTRVAEGDLLTSATGVVDPREALIARGQRYFTGQGEDYGQNWSCNGCHTDGLSDTIIWNAGPFEDRVVSRPFFWLEGTFPLGWAGYQSNVRNYALAVNTNIGIRPNTEEFEGLWAYLASLMPPPAANSWTRRDGALSEAAERGKTLYEGEAACVSCHALPLTTSQTRLPEGVTGGATDVPALVGAYRHNVWLKHGEARTLRDATVELLKFMGNDTLDDSQVDDLTRYMSELTARDLFTLTTSPVAGPRPIAVDSSIKATFSMPIWPSSDNTSSIQLLDEENEEVDCEIEVKGRHVTVTPRGSLRYDKRYTLKIMEGLEAEDETPLFAEETHEFQTAKRPTLTLDGDYDFVVDMPILNIVEGAFDRMSTVEVTLALIATPGENGAALFIDYQEALDMTIRAVVDGDALSSEPFPIPIGPSFADATGMTGAMLTDEDGDGVADAASGTLTISGPGFEESGVTWRLLRSQEQVCRPRTTGEIDVEVTLDAEGYPTIQWDDAVGALALLVTDQSANIPLGPGVVTNGNTYLSMQSADFPTPFKGPITPENPIPEGAEDTTESNGGPAGGGPVPAETCAKVFVLFEGFKISEYIFQN